MTDLERLVQASQLLRNLALHDAKWLCERYHNGLMMAGFDRITAGHLAAEMVNKILEAGNG